jgi:hypothetical protein
MSLNIDFRIRKNKKKIIISKNIMFNKKIAYEDKATTSFEEEMKKTKRIDVNDIIKGIMQNNNDHSNENIDPHV